MINKKMFSARLFFLCIVVLLLGNSCKDNPQPAKSLPIAKKETVQSLSPVYKEIAAYMDLEVSDSTQIETVFNFKALKGEGELVTSDAAQNLRYYKDIMKNGKAEALPIFEVKGSDLTLILLAGKGYVGAVWARVLIDKASGKIIKVRFDHKMESEGYGNGIVSSAFGDQFRDQLISFKDNTFGLIRNGTPVIQGVTLIDGVSGATITCSAVVEMLNEGLKNYEGYLAR